MALVPLVFGLPLWLALRKRLSAQVAAHAHAA